MTYEKNCSLKESTEVKDCPREDRECSFDELQSLRYTLAPKGGDGDPAYVRDMAIRFGTQQQLRTLVELPDGKVQYRREGD